MITWTDLFTRFIRLPQLQFLQEIEHTMSLLAFEDHRNAPLGYLLEHAQRRRVADEVNSAILRSQKQEIGAWRVCWRVPLLLLLEKLTQYADVVLFAVVASLGCTEPMLPTMVRQFRYMEDQLAIKIKRRPKGVHFQSDCAAAASD